MKTYQLVAAGATLAAAIGVAACDNNGSHRSNVLLEQTDRMGVATINTVLIPTGRKDAFNAGDPLTDEADFRTTMSFTIQGLRTAVGGIPGFPAENGGPLGNIPPLALAGVLTPDVITIDLASNAGFPNGRRLTDDVVDTALQLVLNRTGLGDGIGNDSNFLAGFPYLGVPTD